MFYDWVIYVCNGKYANIYTHWLVSILCYSYPENKSSKDRFPQTSGHQLILLTAMYKKC